MGYLGVTSIKNSRQSSDLGVVKLPSFDFSSCLGAISWFCVPPFFQFASWRCTTPVRMIPPMSSSFMGARRVFVCRGLCGIHISTGNGEGETLRSTEDERRGNACVSKGSGSRVYVFAGSGPCVQRETTFVHRVTNENEPKKSESNYTHCNCRCHRHCRWPCLYHVSLRFFMLLVITMTSL